jgi:hypothetical protein
VQLKVAVRKLLEKLADFPDGVNFSDLFEAAANFLPEGANGGQILRLALFHLEMEGRIVKEDRGGTPYFKLTSDGFLKEALHEQNRR